MVNLLKFAFNFKILSDAKLFKVISCITWSQPIYIYNNQNPTKSPLSKWKILKLLHNTCNLFGKNRLVLLKQHNKWMFKLIYSNLWHVKL